MHLVVPGDNVFKIKILMSKYYLSIQNKYIHSKNFSPLISIIKINKMTHQTNIKLTCNLIHHQCEHIKTQISYYMI